ncbi:uracil-DNA glycosylase [Sulfurimonas sp. MAG313]|nr:uracil-DNA glycosylase [Sulfurimonas sp. MAG313]MDF1880614.1 uracil-DNA glycosylase [Sulfurimonas sp. MAG313]
MKLNKQWSLGLEQEFNAPYFKDLISFVNKEYEKLEIYPEKNNIFSAFNSCPLANIKVVILGQDPYHGKNQGHGLAFSVQDKLAFPPSLRNIFQEYTSDTGFITPTNGNLSKWALEGVFLLNTVLTVIEAKAHSHKNKGWETFTDAVIKKISDERENIVFILWGKAAQVKSKLIDESKHMILNAPHPSPLSSYRGFFGSKPFSKVNKYLKTKGINEIDWCLE